MTTDSELVERLRTGDRNAWPDLVRRHTSVVWMVARSHRLDHADAADVVQNTWTALAEHLPRLTRPDRLRAWLTTTARRESLRVRMSRCQEIPSVCFDEPEPADRGPEPLVLRTARDRFLWQAVDRLPDRCRKLLVLGAHAPEMTYAELARALDMNVNSVGRTRGRCLEHLRRLLAQHGIHSEAAG